MNMNLDMITHLTWLANKAAEWNTYTNWPGDLVKNEVEEAFKTFYKSLMSEKNAHIVDLSKLSVQELKVMRFKRWD